jgi:hypothetical protein
LERNKKEAVVPVFAWRDVRQSIKSESVYQTYLLRLKLNTTQLQVKRFNVYVLRFARR